MKTTKRTFNCFDWDDNIVYMPTNIIIFHKKTNEEVSMTTEDFAHFRTYIGKNKNFYSNDGIFSNNKKYKKCNFKDFEIRGDEYKSLSSFREFRDCNNKYFIQHLKEAIENKSFAPEWEYFIYTLNCKKKSKESYIITARGHAPETIYEGLKYLKSQGLIKYLVPLKNIFPVSYFNQDNAYSPQEYKLRVIKDIIKKANNIGGTRVYFSDDDHKTYSFIREAIYKLKIELCHQVEIVLKYTGTKNSSENLFRQVFSTND